VEEVVRIMSQSLNKKWFWRRRHKMGETMGVLALGGVLLGVIFFVI
jgi:hypothetical protein